MKNVQMVQGDEHKHLQIWNNREEIKLDWPKCFEMSSSFTVVPQFTSLCMKLHLLEIGFRPAL